jgi:hypothetical protein
MNSPILPGCEVLPPMQPVSKPIIASYSDLKPAEKPPKRAGDKKRSQARFLRLNAFVDASMRSLTGAEIAVWLVLFRDERNGVARTGQTDIARRSGLSVRGAQKAIKKLTRKGFLEVLKTGSLALGPSCYRVLATSCPPVDE